MTTIGYGLQGTGYGGGGRAGGACPDVLWQEIEIGIIPPDMLTGGFNPPRRDA
jgi:hypothetical protein